MKTTDLTLIANTILDMFEASGIEGANKRDIAQGRFQAKTMNEVPDWRHSVWVKFEQGWGLNATLHVEMSVKDGVAVVEAQPSWGTTTYSLANARIAAKLHMDVVELGEKIEAAFK